jgi:hypothetical protein
MVFYKEATPITNETASFFCQFRTASAVLPLKIKTKNEPECIIAT